MRLGGLQKFSLIDFPGRLAATIFTQGCLFRCHYCHNPELVLPRCFDKPLAEEDFWAFLKSRQGELDGVVISGGEPTIYKDLPTFIAKIKAMGFAVKLDTAGVRPDMLEGLLNKNELDYIAMDIKAPLQRYWEVVGAEVDTEAIRESIGLIIRSGIDHEFRTTVVPGLLDDGDIVQISQLIRGARRYALQSFRPGKTLNPAYQKIPAAPSQWLKELAKAVDPSVETLVRG